MNKANNPFFYSGVNPTVDLIVVNSKAEILIIKRKSTSLACPSMWAFPGGFIDSNQSEGDFWREDRESPEAAAMRELREETGLVLPKKIKLHFVGIYEGNGRDPRDNRDSWSKSYVFFHAVNDKILKSQKDNIRGLDDAEEAKWIKIIDLLELKMAFDHNFILLDALKFI
jgi:8-oxo-dGTP diphosphatase